MERLPRQLAARQLLFAFAALVAIQPFSLAGAYMAGKAIVGALHSGGAASLTTGLLLATLGVALAIGPYYFVLRPRISAYRNARNVHYVITNRRVMMLYMRDGRIEEERIRPLNAISEPRLKMLSSSGVGSVILDAGGTVQSGGEGADFLSHYDIGFEGVADATEAMDILQKAVDDHHWR